MLQWLVLVSALEDLAVVGKLDHASMDLLQSFAVQNAHKFAQVTMPIMPLGDDDNQTKCQKCIHGVGECVMEEAFKHLKESCNQTTDVRWERVCKVMGEHPHKTVGAMLVWVRPQGLAGMYCLGHGDCQDREELEASAPEEYAMAATELSLEDLSFEHKPRHPEEEAEEDHHHPEEDHHRHHHHRHHRHGDRQEGPEFMGKGKGKGDRHHYRHHEGDDEDERQEGPEFMGKGKGDRHHHRHHEGDDEDERQEGPEFMGKGKGKGKGPFMECVKFGTRKVMGMTIRHLQEECKTTQCPKMQAFCKWAPEHKEMAVGMVFANVQPWKYAQGGCYEHFHRHGHHRGPPPHGPPHGPPQGAGPVQKIKAAVASLFV